MKYSWLFSVLMVNLILGCSFAHDFNWNNPKESIAREIHCDEDSIDVTSINSSVEGSVWFARCAGRIFRCTYVPRGGFIPEFYCYEGVH